MSLFRLTFGWKMKPFEGIPGPPPVFPAGNAGDFVLGQLSGKQAWEITSEWAEKYGGLMVIYLGPEPALVLNDPKLIEQALTNLDDFYKDQPCAALMPVVTSSNPFVLNGDAWAKAREGAPFSQPWFGDWLKTRVNLLSNYVVQRVERMTTEPKQVDLMKSMLRFGFDLFSMALLGRELGDAAFRHFMCMADTGSRRIKTPLSVMPPPINPLFYSAKAEWEKIFDTFVAEARVQPEGDDLARVSLRNGIQLSDKLLSLAISNAYFGGGFSAPSAIATTLYLLNMNPSIQEKVRAELKEKVTPDFNWDDLQSCNEMRYSLLEALRFLPPVPLYFRNTSKSKKVNIGGHEIPSNTQCFISNYYLQKNGPHWENPEKYDPSRWANGGEEKNPIGSDYFFPFGRGPRECMGLPFALFLVQTTLAAFLSQGYFDVDASSKYVQDFFFGVMMPKDVKGVVKP